MSEAERVLAVVAGLIRHHGRDGAMLDVRKLETLTAPYLPKPEPDRLTLAARECVAVDCTGASAKLIMDGKFDESDEFRDTRAIIAREVAAAEPSDEALGRVYSAVVNSDYISVSDTIQSMRAALKGEGA